MIRLLPVPTVNVVETRPLWEPFLRSIAKRSQSSFDEMVRQIVTGEAQIHFAWDMEASRPLAMAGTMIETNSNGQLICHIIWCTGLRAEGWVDLVDEIAAWAKSHIGCVAMKATARLGWSKFLRPKGYRATHIVLERGL